MVAGRYRADVIAVDLHPGIAEQRARSERAPGCRPAGRLKVGLVQADASGPPLADESVDRATAVSTIEHVTGPDGDRRAGEIARVLKPGGVARLTVP